MKHGNALNLFDKQENGTNHIDTFNPELTEAALALFSHRKSGHMGSHRYIDPAFEGDPLDGPKLWAKFLREDPAYYVLKDEIEVIAENAGKVNSKIDSPVSVLEFGPGSRTAIHNKTVPIIRAFERVSNYGAVDVSEEYLNNAYNEVEQALPHVRQRSIQSDFYEGAIPHPAGTTPVGLMVGLTMFNQEGHPKDGKPIEQIAAQLKKLKRHVGSGYMIFTADTNQDEAHMTNAYQGIKELEVNMLMRIQRDCNTRGFDYRNFEHEFKWDKDAGMLSFFFVSKKDQTFSIDGRRFAIRAGEKFCFNNSIKLSVEDNITIAKKAGFNVVDIHGTENNPMKLMVLKAS